MPSLAQQIAFIKEVDKIKNIFRKNLNFSNERFENDAEHSWHLCIMAVTLAEYANEPVDLLRVIKMLLIHDVVEIDVGDVMIYKKTDADSEAEKEAAHRIFGMLPPGQKQEYLDLWLEFEELNTPDACYARSIDRLEPMLQNLHYECRIWNHHGVTYDQIVSVTGKIDEGSHVLWDYALSILDRLREEGKIS